MINPYLENFTKEELIELIEIYSKNWLAMDGLWFQRFEKPTEWTKLWKMTAGFGRFHCD